MTRRRLGQNFLVDRAAIARIVEALDPGPRDAVVEIGPGHGALTGPLIERAGRVVAVELDARLAAALRQRFGEEVLLLRTGDVLEHDLPALAAEAGRGTSARVLVVGNLPYSISKPVAMRLVAARHAVSRAVLMFQREVAERLTAEPCTASYGPLSVLCQLAYRIERCFDLPPSAFRPSPAVRSTVTRWSPREESTLAPALEPRLRASLRACFARRRQTLRNNLRAALGADTAAALLRQSGLAPTRRAEQLEAQEFVRLAELWPRSGLV